MKFRFMKMAMLIPVPRPLAIDPFIAVRLQGIYDVVRLLSITALFAEYNCRKFAAQYNPAWPRGYGVDASAGILPDEGKRVTMKKFFRAVLFVLFVGGWALASSALYVVRTPAKVLIFPKNQLEFRDTYVDTRSWTISEDRAHPEVVARVLQLGKSDALAHTVNTNMGPVSANLPPPSQLLL